MTQESPAKAFKRGLLVGVNGPRRGTLYPLGDAGLALTGDLAWESRRSTGDGYLAELYREGDSVRLVSKSEGIRVCGELTGKDTVEVPCNGSVEIEPCLYRAYYLTPGWEAVGKEELENRVTPSLSGLLPSDRKLPEQCVNFEEPLANPFVDAFLESLWPVHGIRDFLTPFVRDPLDTIRSQNEFLRTIGVWEERRQAAQGLLLLNARLEAALFPQSPEKTNETYTELHNVTYFAQNDYLPGHRFVLGEQSTYNREKLLVDKTQDALAGTKSKDRLLDFLVDSRLVGAAHAQDLFTAALKVFFSLTDRFPSIPFVVDNDSRTLVLHDFFDQGGVCRHKCAALQVALQEAGVPSRYLRGKLFLGGYHAWIEVDILRDGSYLLILDPHLCNVLLKTGTLRSGQGRLYFRDEGYPITDIYNTVWRGKLREEK